MEKTKEELVRELMYLGFASAAGAFRLYPDNKHTFADHSDYLMEKGLKIFDQFKDERCDAMGHYGGEKPEGICPKCGEPWKSPEAARHHQSPVADDPFIQKHLKIIMGKTADAMIQMNIEKMWGGLEMASVQFFIDTGKINGNFHIRLKEMMIKFAERWHTTAALSAHPSSLTGDAVEFAEWISEKVEAHYFVNGKAQYVLLDYPDLFTTEQLYKLFLSRDH